MGLQDSLASWF